MTNAVAPIRRFTDDDAQRVNAAALRFAQRHQLRLDTDHDVTPRCALEMLLWGTYPEQRHHLAPLWQACLCRALRVPVAASVTIAYGYIGHRVPN